MRVRNTDKPYSTLVKVGHATMVTCGERRPVHSVRLSRGRNPYILICAMWLMGKSCVQKRTCGRTLEWGENMCQSVCDC